MMRKNLCILLLMIAISQFNLISGGIPDRIQSNLENETVESNIKKLIYEYTGHPSWIFYELIGDGTRIEKIFNNKGKLIKEINDGLISQYYYKNSMLIKSYHEYFDDLENLKEFEIEYIHNERGMLISEEILDIKNLNSKKEVYLSSNREYFPLKSFKREYFYDEDQLFKVIESFYSKPYDAINERVNIISYGNGEKEVSVFSSHNPELISKFINNEDFTEVDFSSYSLIIHTESSHFYDINPQEMYNNLDSNQIDPKPKKVYIYKNNIIDKIIGFAPIDTYAPTPFEFNIIKYSTDGYEKSQQEFLHKEVNDEIVLVQQNLYYSEYYDYDRNNNWAKQETTWVNSSGEELYSVLYRQIEYY